MRKVILFIFFILYFYDGLAQTLSPKVIATSGSYSSSNGIILSSTVGETFTTTLSNGGLYLTQGFQQPENRTVSLTINEGKDTISLCADSVILTAEEGFLCYAWSTGDTARSIVAKRSGWYKCTGLKFAASGSDSVYVSLVYGKISAQYTTIVKGESDSIRVSGSSKVLWSTGDTSHLIISRIYQNTEFKVTLTNNITTCRDSIRILVYPQVDSITRYQPNAELTNASAVDYKVYFSKDVTGVDVTDFKLTKESTADGLISQVTPVDASTYVVTVSGLSGDGRLRLDLKDTLTGIKDFDNTNIYSGYTSGATYLLDHTAPETSIPTKPAVLVNSSNANFVFRSSENSSSFEWSLDAGSYTSITDSTKSFTGLSEGSHTIRVRARDAAGNVDATPEAWTWTIDLTAPTVVSIKRQNPIDSLTTATTLVWKVRFSESVSNVDASDFAISAISPAAAQVTGVTKLSDSLYEVTASVSNVTGGSLRLDLKAAGTSITDAAGNAIAAGYTTGESYGYDGTPPETSIINYPPLNSNSAAANFVFRSNESPVTFEWSLDAGSYTSISDSTKSFTGLSEGSHTIRVRARDAAGNVDATPEAWTWNIDLTAPTVVSIKRQNPIDSLTTATTLVWKVRFSEAVSNVDASDFAISAISPAAAQVTGVTKLSDSLYEVTASVSNATGGALRLDLKASGTSIMDAAGNTIAAGYTSGELYGYDTTPPETTIFSYPSKKTKNTNANFIFRSSKSPARFEVSFFGSTYTLIPDSTISYSGLSAGTYTLNVRAVDAAGNKDASPASWTWTVDLTAPSLVSSNRQVPVDSITNATSLTWRTRFSEAVLGVDTSDFTLTAVAPAVGKLSGITKVADSIYDVSATVSNNTGGSLRLDLKSSGTGITDTATNAIAGGFTTGQKYTLNNVSIKCPANITVAAAAGRCTQTVAFTGVNAVTVTGVTSPVITYSPVSGTAFAVGTTTVTATVKSGTTTVGTCTFTVTVTDAQLPTVSALTVSPALLAPADHTLKTINLTYTATDNCTPVTSVVTVTSNEPDAGTGVGDLPGDIVVVSAKQIQLRAEKAPGSAARVYTITLTVTDKGGNKIVKTAEVRVVHEIMSPGTGSCFAINSTVPFNGQYWDIAGLTHTATWSADALSIAGTDLEPSGASNGTVTGSNRFTTAGVYKMKMNVRDSKNVTTFSDLNKGLSALITIFGTTGTYSYGGGCLDLPAGSLVAKPTVSGKASFGFTVSGATATTGTGEVELDFRIGAWEFNTTTITNYSVSGAKLTMSGTGRVTGVTTTYNYTLTAIDGNHPLGGGTDKVRLRVTTTAGAVIFDNNPGALATADPSTAVCTGLGQVYVPGGAAVGALETPREAINLTQEKLPLSIKVSPNPSAYSFRIAIGGGTKEPVKMRLTDLFGRLVDERRELQPNSIIEIGQKLRTGVYMAEFYQGEERVVVKLVKVE